MENSTNIVFVEQKGKNYLFTVPQGIGLKKGDRVLCDTMKGNTEGVCRTDSFEVDKNSLRQIADINGAYFPLKGVIGKSKMVKFEDEHKEKTVVYDGNGNIVMTLTVDDRTKETVREVKRRADVGEWVKVNYSGKIKRIENSCAYFAGCVVTTDGEHISNNSYVVLENYKPENEKQKHWSGKVFCVDARSSGYFTAEEFYGMRF